VGKGNCEYSFSSGETIQLKDGKSRRRISHKDGKTSRPGGRVKLKTKPSRKKKIAEGKVKERTTKKKKPIYPGN